MLQGPALLQNCHRNSLGGEFCHGLIMLNTEFGNPNKPGVCRRVEYLLQLIPWRDDEDACLRQDHRRREILHPGRL